MLQLSVKFTMLFVTMQDLEFHSSGDLAFVEIRTTENEELKMQNFLQDNMALKIPLEHLKQAFSVFQAIFPTPSLLR